MSSTQQHPGESAASPPPSNGETKCTHQAATSWSSKKSFGTGPAHCITRQDSPHHPGKGHFKPLHLPTATDCQFSHPLQQNISVLGPAWKLQLERWCRRQRERRKTFFPMTRSSKAMVEGNSVGFTLIYL